MRVRFTRDYTAHIEGQYRVDLFRKGDEFEGTFAQRLVDGGCPVEVLDGDGVPDGSAAEVLDWVGDDADRAGAALVVETARDKPRSTLIASLEKLTGKAES